MEPAGHRSTAQLLGLDQPVDRSLAGVQLAKAVVDDARVRGNGGGLFDSIGALVGRDLLDQLADRKLASPARLPEVLRTEAESGPERTADVILRLEAPRAEDHRDVLELILVLGRRQVAP